MTVITKPFSEKKQQKEPLVDGSVPVDGMADVERGTIPRTTRPALLIRVNGSRRDRRQVQRIHSLTTTCVLLTSLLMIATCILSGMYYWRQVTVNRMRHFKGWCSVPYMAEETEEQNGLDQMNSGYKELQALASRYQSSDLQSGGPEALIGSNSQSSGDNRGRKEDLFDEHMDLDVEHEEYEMIEVPDFANGRRGRFIHDFNLNKTGIVDLEKERCFLLNLDRTRVLPPSSLFDLVTRMRAGYYDIDTEVVKDNYRVVTPAISDMNAMGYYIAKECALKGFPTYRLEKMTSPIFKRSTTENGEKTIFAEFAGKGISEFNIVNLDAAPGKVH